MPIQAVYSSPLERAVETAQAIASPHVLTPAIRDALGEVRFGQWEGRTFTELSTDPEWAKFNEARSMVRPPGGESMLEVQDRMVRESDEIRMRHAGEMIAIISHADPIRLLIAHYLGSPIDLLQRFEISPASFTKIRFDGDLPAVHCLNSTAGSVI